MFGFLMARDYQDWLKTLEGKRACDINKKTCQRCGHCCAKRPCIPTPRELHKIADFLGIPTKEAVKKYFLIDSFSSSPDGDKFIFPCKDTQTDITGQYIEAERTYDKGYCIFYDKIKKECKIHPVRPMDARLYKCWKGETKYNPVKAWKNVDWSEFIDISDRNTREKGAKME